MVAKDGILAVKWDLQKTVVSSSAFIKIYREKLKKTRREGVGLGFLLAGDFSLAKDINLYYTIYNNIILIFIIHTFWGSRGKCLIYIHGIRFNECINDQKV